MQASSGIPYFYFTDMEMSVHDLHVRQPNYKKKTLHKFCLFQVNNQLSLSMTLAQGDYCKKQGLDTQDPPCARVVLTGSASKVQNGTDEANFAQDAIFSRHPNMRDYPEGHEFYFAKMNIEHICLLAWYGGAKTIAVQDYFNATLI